MHFSNNPLAGKPLIPRIALSCGKVFGFTKEKVMMNQGIEALILRLILIQHAYKIHCQYALWYSKSPTPFRWEKGNVADSIMTWPNNPTMEYSRYRRKPGFVSIPWLGIFNISDGECLWSLLRVITCGQESRSVLHLRAISVILHSLTFFLPEGGFHFSIGWVDKR